MQKISVITPVYNGERYIESCLESVIEQTCPFVEHLIVDGGSTDNTIKIVEHYSKEYLHIKWISEKDKGQSDAMNKGIRLASGSIISILNVDDFYEPNTLNFVLKSFKTLLEPSLLVGNCNVLNHDDAIKYVNAPKNLNWKDVLLKKAPHPFNPSAYFYHSSLHSKIGVYDVDNHYTMDLDFLLKALRIANVKYVDRVLGNYRSIEGTKTNSSRNDGSFRKHSRRARINYISSLPFLLRLQVIFEGLYSYSGTKIKGHFRRFFHADYL